MSVKFKMSQTEFHEFNMFKRISRSRTCIVFYSFIPSTNKRIRNEDTYSYIFPYIYFACLGVFCLFVYLFEIPILYSKTLICLKF